MRPQIRHAFFWSPQYNKDCSISGSILESLHLCKRPYGMLILKSLCEDLIAVFLRGG